MRNDTYPDQSGRFLNDGIIECTHDHMAYGPDEEREACHAAAPISIYGWKGLSIYYGWKGLSIYEFGRADFFRSPDWRVGAKEVWIVTARRRPVGRYLRMARRLAARS